MGGGGVYTLPLLSFPYPPRRVSIHVIPTGEGSPTKQKESGTVSRAALLPELFALLPGFLFGGGVAGTASGTVRTVPAADGLTGAPVSDNAPDNDSSDCEHNRADEERAPVLR